MSVWGWDEDCQLKEYCSVCSGLLSQHWRGRECLGEDTDKAQPTAGAQP